MELHPLARGFADVADEYERGRPGYPEAAIVALGLDPGARVADVGAGTGKLTRALVAAGCDVVAVEPLDGLRARLRAELPGVEALAGTAEALPLADASVDAVCCGDSFHWFDGARAAPELARVIRPGGVLGLLWNGPVAGGETPWSEDLWTILRERMPEHPGHTGDQGRGAIDASGRFEPFRLDTFDNPHRTDRAGLVASVASMSYIGVLPEDERRGVLARVDAVLREHGVEAVEVPLQTKVWTARRRRSA
jgi:SAM-dependent methyltransferase